MKKGREAGPRGQVNVTTGRNKGPFFKVMEEGANHHGVERYSSSPFDTHWDEAKGTSLVHPICVGLRSCYSTTFKRTYYITQTCTHPSSAPEEVRGLCLVDADVGAAVRGR